MSQILRSGVLLVTLSVLLGSSAVWPQSQEGTLPHFGDPLFLVLPPDTGVGRLEFDAPGQSDYAYFDDFPMLRRVTATEAVRFAYRREGQAMQGLANSFIYERDSPAEGSPESFTLIGAVILATPQGTVAAEQIRINIDRDHYDISAQGRIRAELNDQRYTADGLAFRLGPMAGGAPQEGLDSGTIWGDVRIEFLIESEELKVPADGSDPIRSRPFFAGVELAAQRVMVSGERFDLFFTEEGVHRLEATTASVMRLQRQRALEPVPANPASVPLEPLIVTIETGAFVANFENTAAGTTLGDFQAPTGLTLSYPDGSISAAEGYLNLRPGQQRLRFLSRVHVEQEGASMDAHSLEIAFNSAGQVLLEATGRPTFRFSSLNFRPLAEMLGQMRPEVPEQ